MDGDARLDLLEERIAGLERRLASLEMIKASTTPIVSTTAKCDFEAKEGRPFCRTHGWNCPEL